MKLGRFDENWRYGAKTALLFNQAFCVRYGNQLNEIL